MTINFSTDILYRCWGKQVSAAKCQIFFPLIKKYFDKYQIDDKQSLAAFLAMARYETGDLTLKNFAEDYNYTAKNALEIFPKYFSNYSQQELNKIISEKRVFDITYGGREGNAPYPSRDGTNYRGRGLLQLTHKDNYAAFAKASGVDVVANPELLGQNEYAVWSAVWEFAQPRVLSYARNGQFKEVAGIINAGSPKFVAFGLNKRIEYYNTALKELGSDIVYSNGVTGGTNANTTEPLNQNVVEYDFQRLALNIQSLELDNSEVSWGNRSFANEESDWIGLKQFLLYLITRFYPQKLVPFVELIPFFSLQDTYTKKDLAALYYPNASFEQQQDQKRKNVKEGSGIIDEERYQRTVEKLKSLTKGVGVDILTIDPFNEYTDEFNFLNNAGIKIEDKRNVSYKVYGSLVLNPAATEDSLSKPGAIGLTGIEINSGAQDQVGMTLVSVKLRDVQGNKFLDPNSPWSFVLNSKPGQMVADFFFRYGWQIEIPSYDKLDQTSYAFWNHPGWAIFSSLNGEHLEEGDSGLVLKKFLSDLSKKGLGTLTLTHSLNDSAFTKPGFSEEENESGNTVFRKTSPDLLDYYPLTLFFPEINIDSENGSVEVTLNFRTKTAIASCTCPLFKGLYCKGLVARESVNLQELLNQFALDTNTNLSGEKVINSINTKDANSKLDWVTVIGGIGSSSRNDIDPKGINITFSEKRKDEITNAKAQDTTLLLSWLQDVLNENHLFLIVSGDSTHGVRGSGNDSTTFLILLDDDSGVEEKSKKNVSYNELAKVDPSFGDYLNYVSYDASNENFVGKRLQVQDDVFSFRFQGSLVENIQVEKNEATNEAVIASKNVGMESIAENEDKMDINALSNSEITVKDKERALNQIYASMLNINIKAICHPWLKLGRPIYVKGLGFYDGKYFVLKLIHRLEESGKFTTEINAARIISTNVKTDTTNAYLNNPGMGVSEKVDYSQKANTGSFDPNDIPSVSVLTNPNTINKLVVTNTFTPSVISLVMTPEQEAYIKDLHPLFRKTFRSFIKAIENNLNVKVKIIDGYRSVMAQRKNVTSGADGIMNAQPGFSMHNYGMAIDIEIYDKVSNKKLLGKSLINWTEEEKEQNTIAWENSAVVKIARGYGLSWGGRDFGIFHNESHFGFEKSYDMNLLHHNLIKQFGPDETYQKGNELDFGNFK